jgi:signal recognition particle subunit SRP19
MPSRKEGLLVVYPEYFDSRLSRKQGRRIPKAAAREGPTLEDIEKAARAAGMEPMSEPKKAFSSRWFERRGRLLVKKKASKEKTLRSIAKKL